MMGAITSAYRQESQSEDSENASETCPPCSIPQMRSTIAFSHCPRKLPRIKSVNAITVKITKVFTEMRRCFGTSFFIGRRMRYAKGAAQTYSERMVTPKLK